MDSAGPTITFFVGLVFLTVTNAYAETYVRGYTKKNGTYVAPHYRSSPNSTKLDNWSTKGNVNPYTGSIGTKNPYSSYGNTNQYENNSRRSRY